MVIKKFLSYLGSHKISTSFFRITYDSKGKDSRISFDKTEFLLTQYHGCKVTVILP